MSKTPVSELNARMSLDIAPLEQAVPKAEALLGRIEAAQQEALRSQSGGADPAQVQAVQTRAERVAAQRIARIKKQQEEVIDAGKFQLANPFQQQVMASQRLNQLIEHRNKLQQGSVEYETAHLAVLKQQVAVEQLRAGLTAGMDFRRLGNTAEDSLKGFSRFGLAMQQAGYQVQDFAVQVTSGTNVMVAFSQQASQMLGFFGTGGAIAGAVLAVGILVARLRDTAKQAETAKKEVDGLERALASLRDARLGRLLGSGDEFGALKEAAVKAEESRAKMAMDSARDQATFARRQLTEFSNSNESYVRFFPTEAAFREFEAKVAKFREESKGKTFLFGGDEKIINSIAESVGAQLVSRKEGGDLAVKAETDALTLATERTAEYEKQKAAAAEIRKQIEESATNRLFDPAFRDARRANEQFGETLFDTVKRVRTEWAAWALEVSNDPVKVEQVRGELLRAEDAINQMAQGYRDSLDPLSKQRKELETLTRLQDALSADQKFSAQELLLLQSRIADERERQLKLPDAFRAQTGAAFAGMRNTDGTANQLVTLQQQMLAELRKLVWQGSN